MSNGLKQLFTKSAESMSATQRWTSLLVLSGALFVVVMDMTILFLALPSIIHDFKPDAAQQLWIIDIYSLILAGLLIPMSALADRWGRKKILLTGFMIFGFISAGIIFAQTAGFIIMLRAILGISGAMIMPTTLSMIRTIFIDSKERAKAIAVWASVSGLGAVAGPLIGGLLLQNMSWRAAFLINVPIATVAVLAGLFLLPESRNPHPAAWDKPTTILIISGMIGLVWSIKQFAQNGWGSLRIWSILIISLILLISFVIRSLRQEKPMLEVRLFRKLPFTASTITAFFSLFSMSAMLLLISQWLEIVQAWGPLQSGLALLPMGLGVIICSPLAPAIAQRFGARTVLTGGLIISGLGMLLIYLFQPLSYAILVPTLIFIGAGISSLAIASAVIMSSTPSEKAGSAAAIEESVYELGNVFGVAIIGSIAAAAYRHNLAIASFARQGITGQLAKKVNESLIGAQLVARQAHLPELATKALHAFNESLASASLMGAIITIIVAGIIFWMIPSTLDITQQHQE